jgi:hypothetical protein
MYHLLAQSSSGDAAAAGAIGITLIFFLVFGLLYVGLFVWMVYAIIDVNKYPDQAFVSIGQTKQTWLILNIVALFTCVLITAYYWFSVRPKLKAASGI